jgi:hypothetical protein
VASLQFNFIYGILVVSSFLIAIFMLKQRSNRVEAQKTYLEKTYQATKDELLEVLGYGESLLKEISQKDALFDETTTAYIRQIIYHIKDYMRLTVKAVALDQWLLSLKDTLALKDFDPAPQLIVERHVPVSTCYWDTDKLLAAFINSIEILEKYNKAHRPIRLVIEEATLGYSIGYMQGYTKKVAALRIVLTTAEDLPLLQEVYTFDPRTAASQEAGGEVSLLENIRIVDAHYGYSSLEKADTHVYVLPVNVRDVRGKVMELLREPAGANLEELQHPMAIQLEKELLDTLKGTAIDIKVITKALDVIKKYHAGVKRRSGEPFFTHPIAVALILLEYCQDQEAVVGALLHDTVEDTSLSLTQVKALFGETVAFLVAKVTNVEDKMRRLVLDDHENVNRLINYEDKRAAYIKLADRLHNMRTIQGHSSLAKQKHISSETLSFFVPMAMSLGLTAIAEELKERSLAVLGQKD